MTDIHSISYELQYNYISRVDCDVFISEDFASLIRMARSFVNRWQIVRLSDLLEIAMSYDGNTSVEQPAAPRDDSAMSGNANEGSG